MCIFFFFFFWLKCSICGALLIYRNTNKFLLVLSYLFSYRDSIVLFIVHSHTSIYTWISPHRMPFPSFLQFFFFFILLFVAFKFDNTLQTKASSSCQVPLQFWQKLFLLRSWRFIWKKIFLFSQMNTRLFLLSSFECHFCRHIECLPTKICVYLSTQWIL